MPDLHRTTRRRLALIICAMAILATVAEAASNPIIRKGAILLCFALLLPLFFLPGKRPSTAVEDVADDDANNGRQSLPARLAWAAWMSVAAAACFAIAQLAGALTPAFQLPFRGLGAVLLIVAAYKLFFGRRNGNSDIDLG